MAGPFVVLAGLILAQAAVPPPPSPARASFAGTWRLDPARSASAADESADPIVVEIAQTDRELTVATIQGTRRHQVAYVFTSGPPIAYGVDGTVGRASWNGQALVTEGTRLIQGQTVATRETRTLNADGTEMTIEVIVIVQHGYQFRGARNYGVGKDVYTRVTR